MTEGLYVLEWSKKQCATHVQKFDDTLKTNRIKYMNDECANDYIQIAAGSLDEMLKTSESIRKTLQERQERMKHD